MDNYVFKNNNHIFITYFIFPQSSFRGVNKHTQRVFWAKRFNPKGTAIGGQEKKRETRVATRVLQSRAKSDRAKMPCLNLSTNVSLDGVDTSSILSEATSTVAKIIGKPEAVTSIFLSFHIHFLMLYMFLISDFSLT